MGRPTEPQLAVAGGPAAPAPFAATSDVSAVTASPYLWKKPDTEVSSEQVDGPLSGLTVAVKDSLVTADGAPTTAASRMLERFVSPYEATVVRKIRRAGATIVGKTNLDEFAMGSSTENSALGVTVNPWDESRVPGGTSGGSAAAVADGSADLAIGSDTGGSIRQPASFCGVVGLKPTYGRVSRHGLIAMASSLEQAGPLARTVSQAALLLGVLAGRDPHDATSVDTPVPDYAAALQKDVKGLTVGLPKEYASPGMQTEVAEAVATAGEDLQAAGAVLKEVSLPHTEYAVATYYIVMAAEASSNLARYDGIRYGYSAQTDPEVSSTLQSLEDVYFTSRSRGFGPEVQRRVILGTYVLSAGYYDAYYKKAMLVRRLIRRDFERAFGECDILLTPTAPTTAFKRGENVEDPLQMYLNDIFTVPASLAGIPGISVPAGFDAGGLPIGLQLLGPHFGEEKILRVAHSYEQQHDWHTRRPSQSAT